MYTFEGYVKELKVEEDQYTCKFKIDSTVTVDGKEYAVSVKEDTVSNLLDDKFGIIDNNSDIFQFISQHSKEKLLVGIDDNKSQIESVALIYG